MKINFSLLSLFAGATGGAAFALTPSSLRKYPTTLLKSEPSDTSSDYYVDEDIVEIESESYNPSPEEAVVNSIMDLIPSSLGDVTEETRSAINEVLLKLESMNPTKEPTLSSLLNGTPT